MLYEFKSIVIDQFNKNLFIRLIGCSFFKIGGQCTLGSTAKLNWTTEFIRNESNSLLVYVSSTKLHFKLLVKIRFYTWLLNIYIFSSTSLENEVKFFTIIDIF